MSDSQLTHIIRSLMEEQGRTPKVEIVSACRLREDLGFDSLELAILTVRIEAEFGVDVFSDGIVSTIEEIEAKLPHNTP